MILLTQSFGREYEYRRAVFAILSFYAHRKDYNFTTYLFTDNPQWFAPYFEGIKVEYVLLTEQKVKQMRGAIDFLHHMKIAMIDEAFQKADTDIFYIDSDTFFVADPVVYMQALAPGHSFMHLCEYKFETLRNMPLPGGKTFHAFLNLIETHSFLLSDESSFTVSPALSSWNAGVMLLHQSHQKLIRDVYRLTEQFYPPTDNHASEQYAFSIVLQKNTELAACEDTIYHYWYNVKKKVADEFLQQHLDKIAGADLQTKMNTILQWTNRLPSYFDTHLFTLKDKAVQAFNENQYGKAYQWAFRAMAKGAFKDRVFVKDILYHTKRCFTGK